VALSADLSGGQAEIKRGTGTDMAGDAQLGGRAELLDVELRFARSDARDLLEQNYVCYGRTASATVHARKEFDQALTYLRREAEHARRSCRASAQPSP
jgi:hypothetical protein